MSPFILPFCHVPVCFFGGICVQIGKQKMQEIYDIVKTPYKYGAVIKIDDCLTDCPAVFKYKDKWYMY